MIRRLLPRIAMVDTKTIDGGSAVSPLVHKQRYQLGNHLGSASIELDDAANVITYEEYYPFGGTSFHQPDSLTDYSTKRYRYNGKEKDEETGLYYYGARYYAAWLGRWIAADPAGMVDGPCVYAYVSNNPVMFIDPSGTEGEGPVIEPTDEDENAEAKLRLVLCYTSNDGYSFLSLIRASSVVNRQLMVAWSALRFLSQADTSRRSAC